MKKLLLLLLLPRLAFADQPVRLECVVLPTYTSTPAPTDTITPSATPILTSSPTASPTATITETPEPEPTSTAVATPTETPNPNGGFLPTCEDLSPPDGHFHTDDQSKADEHKAMLNLVPFSSMKHWSVKDGNWSDAHTWNNNLIPTSGSNVLICPKTTVTYDAAPNKGTPINRLRVDGTLQFSTSSSTGLDVDTIVETPLGHFIVGSADKPIPQGISTLIRFTSDGPIQTSTAGDDPLLMRRGYIGHGDTQIHGAKLTTFVPVMGSHRTGETVIHLAEMPSNWHVGDTVVLTGTTYLKVLHVAPNVDNYDYDTFDKAEISAIDDDAKTVTLSAPLKSDHVVPEGVYTYLANLTRNIVFSSASSERLERGHFMIMHTNSAEVMYASFEKLGRFSKQGYQDPAISVHCKNGPDSSPITTAGTGTNVFGRYSLHVHRAGTATGSKAIQIIGNSVTDNPGWGYVNHEAHVDFKENVAFNISGAGFADELGTETGSFIHNAAINIYGNGATNRIWVRGIDGTDERWYFQEGAGETVECMNEARGGIGFFVKSSLTAANDNVASNTALTGYMWKGKSYDGRTIPRADMLLPELLNGDDSAARQEVDFIVGEFDRDYSAASFACFYVNMFSESIRPGRSVMRDSTGIGCYQEGANISYTANLTAIDMKIYLDEYTAGLDPYWRPKPRGITQGNSNFGDMAYVRPQFHGLDAGFLLNVPVKTAIVDAVYESTPQEIDNPSNTQVTIVNNNALDTALLSTSPTMTLGWGGIYSMGGTITDGLGEHVISTDWATYFWRPYEETRRNIASCIDPQTNLGYFQIAWVISNTLTGENKIMHGRIYDVNSTARFPTLNEKCYDSIKPDFSFDCNGNVTPTEKVVCKLMEPK